LGNFCGQTGAAGQKLRTNIFFIVSGFAK